MSFYKYEIRKTAELIPYAMNSRTHDEKQVAQIASAIKEFGFTNPVLIEPDGGVIAGHGRLLAADKLNMEELPCIIIEGLTDAQKKALVIADNQIATNSKWNDELLKSEISALSGMDYDLDILGFKDTDIMKALADDDDEEKPEVVFSEELSEEHNYIVLYFDDSVDWLQCETLLDGMMKTVADNSSKGNYKKQGVGRVLNGAEVLKRLVGK